MTVGIGREGDVLEGDGFDVGDDPGMSGLERRDCIAKELQVDLAVSDGHLQVRACRGRVVGRDVHEAHRVAWVAVGLIQALNARRNAARRGCLVHVLPFLRHDECFLSRKRMPAQVAVAPISSCRPVTRASKVSLSTISRTSVGPRMTSPV